MSELLDFRAKVDFTQAKRDLKEFEKMLAEAKISPASNAKDRDSSRAAHLATMDALKRERLEILEQNKLRAEANRKIAELNLAEKERTAELRQQAQLKKEAGGRKTVISNSQAEVDAYNKTLNGSKAVTDVLNEQDRAQQAVANSATAAGRATVENDRVQKRTVLTKKQLQQALIEEKYIQSQATAEMKNNAREMLNAKGSLEQRRAALIRLTKAYDQLSASERNSAAGQRLKGIVVGVNQQVLQLEKDTLRAQRNVGNYGGALGKAWSGLKFIANILPGVGIAGLLAFAIDPIVNYIRQLDFFKERVDKIKLAKKALEDVNTLGAQNAQTEITRLKVLYATAQNVKLSTEQRTRAVKDLQNLYPKTFKNFSDEQIQLGKVGVAYDNLTKSIIATARARASEQKIAENASRQLADEQIIAEERVTNETIRREIAKTQAQYAEARKRGFSQIGATGVSSQENEFLLRLADLNNKLAESDKKITDAASDRAILNERNLALTKNIFDQQQKGAEITERSNKATATRLTEAETLSKRLTELHNASFRKTLETDDAEIQAVKDKYAQIKREVDAFYKDPKNTGASIKINGKNVSKSEVYGILKADAQQEEDAILFKREQDKRKRDEKEAEDHYKQLLKDYRDFGQQMEDARKRFEADAALLANDPRNLAVRKQAYDKELQDLVDANSKKLDEYEKLLEGIEAMSRKEALAVLENARTVLANDRSAGTVSEKVAKETEELFDKTKKAIIRGTKEAGEELIDLANMIDQVVSSVGNVDSAFAQVLSTVSNVVGQVGNIQKGMDDFKSATTGLGQLTAGLGIVGAGVSIFSSIFKLFDRSAKREEQAAYARDLQNKQTEALNKALQRQVELLDDVYGTERILKYGEALAKARENEAKYTEQLKGRLQLTGDKNLDEQIQKFNETGKVDFLYKSLIADIQASGKFGLPTDLAELQQLLDEGKLDSSTATIVTNLIEANKMAQELANNLRAERVGASLGTIVDEFITNLTDGIGSAEEFLTKSLRRGLLKALEGDITEKYLQDYYKKLDEALMDGKITSEEDALLRNIYKDADEYGKKRLEYINSVAPDTEGTSNNGTLSARVSTITTDQADLLAGRLGGMQISLVQTNAEVKRMADSFGKVYDVSLRKLDALVKIEANTLRTANNTDRLERVEAALISIDRKMDENAKALNGNGYGPI
ncbi:hypothetical protein [Pedobacter faecalis]|uniref:hypothetical protein n=1 Tax=Pedobacter faecalis TaxID=3041495 RepID=UPI00254BAF68|nr:hypothetical protein [Pedobacter sp. ELA7]